MNHHDIEQTIYRAVRKVKPSLVDAPLGPATRFEDYYISSLELAMITFEIEETFDLNIADANLDIFRDIAEARDLVARLLERHHRQPHQHFGPTAALLLDSPPTTPPGPRSTA